MRDGAVYLRFGALPGLLHEASDADRMELLSNLVSTYLLKDIRALDLHGVSLGSFSRNLANELKKSRKYYLYDLGIRNM